MPPTTPAFPAWQRDLALLGLASFTAFALAIVAKPTFNDDTFGGWLIRRPAARRRLLRHARRRFEWAFVQARPNALTAAASTPTAIGKPEAP
ncbi:MAG TPA: hypothetical protein VG407_18685 [Caulobacteraceae bacterium]|jgi:hypothetical protein|nr:hypothetical protein [Caulobacteraceae bacterium]